MAKIVKVNTTRHADGAITYTVDHQSWQPWRLAPKIVLIAFEGIRDLSKKYCIGVVKDADLAEFIIESNIVEITQLEAIALGDVWRPQVKKITDMNKVLNIMDKVHNLLELTQAEKDAINPDNPETGINQSSTFTDRLTASMGAIDGR